MPEPTNRTSFRRGNHLLDQLGPDDFAEVARAVVCAECELVVEGRDDVLVEMTENERTVSDRIVDEIVAVDIPFVRTVGTFHVEREWFLVPSVVGHSAGERAARTLIERFRTGETRFEFLLQRRTIRGGDHVELLLNEPRKHANNTVRV